MSQNAKAFDDDSFEPQDDFLDDGGAETSASDPFLDTESIERRLLGDAADDFGADGPEQDPFESSGQRPFGARLADANSEFDDGFDVDG